MANDHRVDIYLDPVTYLALKARSAETERNLSQHIRHLIKQDIVQSLTEEGGGGNGNGTGSTRESD